MNISSSPQRLRRPLFECVRRFSRPSNSPFQRAPVTSYRPSSTSQRSRGSLDAITLHRLEAQRRAYYLRRSYYAAAGALSCMGAIFLLVYVSDIPKPEKNDAGPNDPLNDVERGTPVVKGVTGGTEIRKTGEGTAPLPGTRKGDGVEQVPTGTTTIPTFPKTIELASADEAAVGGKAEYQLVGLGIRTVSFLSIQVYVVGLYIATEDIAALQQSLVRKIDPVATTLIKSEKVKLRDMLLDPEQSETIWDSVLKDTKMRSAIRIVPTRNTDFQHLRDGWVRGITTRTQKASSTGRDEFEDEGFGMAMQTFKGIFSGGARKTIPKATTVLLLRDRQGALDAWFDDGEQDGPQRMGTVKDERVSRLVWMNYLAGKKVASEGARQKVVDGVMDFVERPIGTVATQVL
ncbi:MAG: Altered inheritance of mitochondria protein 18 mitochondrial [Sclerophora amabilis]|nr:MAG: Altered inheritance of mitochondria protein 18 mitochondrial [Sclerophora amabilis]